MSEQLRPQDDMTPRPVQRLQTAVLQRQRMGQLIRLNTRFDRLQERLADNDGKPFYLPLVDFDGNFFRQKIDSHFLFGMYLARRGLAQEFLKY